MESKLCVGCIICGRSVPISQWEIDRPDQIVRVCDDCKNAVNQMNDFNRVVGEIYGILAEIHYQLAELENKK